MIPINLLPDVLAVEISEPDATNFHIMQTGNPKTLSYEHSIVKGQRGSTGLIAMINLPPGSYEIIGTVKDCSEEQAAQVCPGQWSKYFENRDTPLFQDFSDGIWRLDTALESLSSLLTSKGLVGANYLLIRKIEVAC
jgi:hypothetical protein